MWTSRPHACDWGTLRRVLDHRGIKAAKHCLFAALISACGPGGPDGGGVSVPLDGSGGAPNGQPVVVTDDAQRRHEFVSPPGRIISLVPSATETLLAFGLGDHLVGRTEYDRTPELSSLPSVGGGLQPNLEILLALEPDLVIRFAGESDRATAERLTDLGIPHFAIQPDGIADVQSIIRRLGVITGAEAAADSLLAEIRSALADVQERVEGLPLRRVAYLLGGEPPWVAGPGTYIHELMILGGGTNVFDDLGQLYVPVSLEELIDRKPDLLLIAESGSTPPELSSIPSVRLPGSIEVPGPGLGDAAREVARLIHPEAFR